MDFLGICLCWHGEVALRRDNKIERRFRGCVDNVEILKTCTPSCMRTIKITMLYDMEAAARPNVSVIMSREVIGHTFLDVGVAAGFEVSIGRYAEPNQTSACHWEGKRAF